MKGTFHYEKVKFLEENMTEVEIMQKKLREMRQYIRKNFCNNYRKMHGLPMRRKGGIC